MRTGAISILMLAPWLVGAAPSIDEQTRKDVRCFIVISMLNQSDNAELRDAARVGSQYFLGRIDGRAPGIDLEDAIAAEAPAAVADQKALFTSCGALMKERGDQVKAIGDRLTARGI